MKLSTLLAALALAAISNTAHTTEMANSDDENFAYCNEQAERDGVEDIDEKNLYIKECVESFTIQSDDDQQ